MHLIAPRYPAKIRNGAKLARGLSSALLVDPAIDNFRDILRPANVFTSATIQSRTIFPAFGDVMNLGSSDALTLPRAIVTAPAFTFSMWVNHNALTNGEEMFRIEDSANPDDHFRMLIQADGTARFAARTTGTSTANADTAAGVVIAGTWHLFTAVAAAANSRSIFVDGANKVTSATSKSPAGLNKTYLGNGLAGTTLFGPILIHGRALADSEVADLYNVLLRFSMFEIGDEQRALIFTVAGGASYDETNLQIDMGIDVTETDIEAFSDVGLDLSMGIETTASDTQAYSDIDQDLSLGVETTTTDTQAFSEVDRDLSAGIDFSESHTAAVIEDSGIDVGMDFAESHTSAAIEDASMDLGFIADGNDAIAFVETHTLDVGIEMAGTDFYSFDETNLDVSLGVEFMSVETHASNETGLSVDFGIETLATDLASMLEAAQVDFGLEITELDVASWAELMSQIDLGIEILVVELGAGSAITRTWTAAFHRTRSNAASFHTTTTRVAKF